MTDPEPTYTEPVRMRPEPVRDRWKRYMLPDRDGNVVPWTRVTTICGTLDRGENLKDYKARNVARGVGMNPGLAALAASHVDQNGEDKGVYQGIIADAEVLAGANTKRDKGTALHKFCEAVELGLMELTDVIEPWRGRVRQYLRAIEQAGLILVPEATEQIYYHDDYGVAGTGDRAYRAHKTMTPRMTDLKTGRVDYGARKIPCQVAAYQEHTATFDTRTNERGEPFELDPITGYLIHLPADGTTCDIFTVDLVRGRELYALGRGMHKASQLGFDDVFSPHRPVDGLTPYEQIAERLWFLGAKPGGQQVLRTTWPASVRSPWPADPTPEEYDTMDEWLGPLESAYQVGFPRKLMSVS